VYAVDFIVRRNYANIIRQRPLTGRCRLFPISRSIGIILIKIKTEERLAFGQPLNQGVFCSGAKHKSV
jgi:hypothetical protein